MPQSSIRRAIALAGAGVLVAMTTSGCFLLNRARDVVPLPAPSASINLPGGSGSFSGGGNAKLPAEWPADVPTPNGLALQGAGTVSGESTKGRSMTASFKGTGNLSEIMADMNAKLKQAGYKSDADFNGTEGGMAVWTKGTTKVQIVSQMEGADVTVVESVYIPAG